ncbi:hypothetical protein LMIY3S_04640 [Labrys miyagiensis]
MPPTMPRPVSLSSLLGLAMVLGLLSACASPASKIYTLTTLERTPSSGRPVSISIETVDLPKYLDRPQFVRRSSDVQLDISEFERWGEPFGSMIQRVLAEDLRRHLPARSLVTTSQTTTGTEAATLEFSVNRFEPGPTGEIAMQAQWRLHYRSGGRGPGAQAIVIVRPAAADTGSQVEAMSKALDEFAAKIALALR